MAMFELSGKFLENRLWKKFTRVVNADSEKLAKDKIWSLFGSEHKAPRRNIKIDSAKITKEAK